MAMICACSIACWLATSLIRETYAAGRLAIWHSLGAPPGKAIRIARLNPRWGDHIVEVEVATTTGQFFRYAMEQRRWIEIETIPESEELGFMGVRDCERIPEGAFTSYLSRLPAKPIDCATMIWSWEWVSDEVHFAVLEDGSVWWWHYHLGLDTAILLCGASLLLGTGSGVALFVIFRRWRAHPPARTATTEEVSSW